MHNETGKIITPIYEFDGARKRLIKNPSPYLSEGRLLQITSYGALVDMLKNEFFGEDVIAVYSPSIISSTLNKNKGAQHFRNMHLMRGNLIKVEAGGLFFDGPGGVTPFGEIPYKGSSWLPPLDSMVDIIFSSSAGSLPHIPLREYTFRTTCCGVELETDDGKKVRGRNSIDAFLTLTVENEYLRHELEKGSTFPVTLTKIRLLKDD